MCDKYEDEWDKYDKYDILDYMLIYDNETEEVIDELPIYDDGSDYSEWFKREVLHISKDDTKSEEER